MWTYFAIFFYFQLRQLGLCPPDLPSEEVVAGPTSIEVPGGYANTGLAWDPVDQIFLIGNFLTGSIHKVSLAGEDLGEILTPVGQKNIQGIAYDTSDDSLWVAKHFGKAIFHLQKDGTEIREERIMNLGFKPNGVAYDPAADSIWIVEAYTNRIHEYSAETQSWIKTIEVEGFKNLDGLSLHENQLWVTYDFYPKGIAVVDPTDGFVLRSFSVDAQSPEGLVIFENSFYLNDDSGYHRQEAAGNRLHRYNFEGTPQSFLDVVEEAGQREI